MTGFPEPTVDADGTVAADTLAELAVGLAASPERPTGPGQSTGPGRRNGARAQRGDAPWTS